MGILENCEPNSAVIIQRGSKNFPADLLLCCRLELPQILLMFMLQQYGQKFHNIPFNTCPMV